MRLQRAPSNGLMTTLTPAVRPQIPLALVQNIVLSGHEVERIAFGLRPVRLLNNNVPVPGFTTIAEKSCLDVSFIL